jgi:hypothetical protein
MLCCDAWFAGLTKVPIDGQPLSIVQDLEEMCRQYIKVWASRAMQSCPSAAFITAAGAGAATAEHQAWLVAPTAEVAAGSHVAATAGACVWQLYSRRLCPLRPLSVHAGRMWQQPSLGSCAPLSSS